MLVARQADIVAAHRYGVSGQRQGGIDIYAIDGTGAITTYQCRRYRAMTVNHVRSATEDFRNGRWFSDLSRFELWTSADLRDIGLDDELRSIRSELGAVGKDFHWKGVEEISELLIQEPHVAFVAFGRAWVEAVSGGRLPSALEGWIETPDLLKVAEAVQRVVGRRLTAHDFVDLQVDEASDVLALGPHAFHEAVGLPSEPEADDDQRWRPRIDQSAYRSSAVEWLSRQESGNRLLVGGAGSGKSTTAIHAVSRLCTVGDGADLQARVTVWAPFAEVLAIRRRSPEISLPDAIGRWYRARGVTEPVAALIAAASTDGRATIFLDGLDEHQEAHHQQVVQLLEDLQDL